MPRVVSLFLPSWPTDRVRRNLGEAAPPVETPLVLLGREGRRRVVLAADAAALHSGLTRLLSVDQSPAAGEWLYGDRTVDVHLSWLRRKLGETAAEPRYLHSSRGVGVRLAAPDEV